METCFDRRLVVEVDLPMNEIYHELQSPSPTLPQHSQEANSGTAANNYVCLAFFLNRGYFFLEYGQWSVGQCFF
jgi:hypothetical protein